MTNQDNSKLLYKNKIDYFKDKDKDKDKDKLYFRKKNNIWIEYLILIGSVFIFGFYVISNDFSEWISGWMQIYENYQLDEIFIIFVFFMFGFGIFAIRRFKDLWNERKYRDIAETKIYEYALFDKLTGLTNRNVFSQNLEIVLSRLEKNSEKIAVHMIDLDKFKEINDNYGHEIGDEVLKIAAKRIRSVVRDEDTVSRLGGDEFNIIQNNIISSEDTVMLGDRLIAAFDKTMAINNLNIFVSVSIGTTICDNSKIKSSKLLREADIAMYRAKKENNSSFCLYNEDMGEIFNKHEMIKRELRYAITKEEFELYYQPQFTIDKKLIGFEALLRWTHPKMGMVSPGIFIPIAEECDLIEGIDEWVLKKACQAAANWDEELSVAVNISAMQFKNKNFIEKLKKIIKLTALDPKRLEIEITESILISNIITAKKNIFDIKKLGVKVVMDDFGTGYSSLSYLRELPFDMVKIDRSFIKNLTLNNKNLYIIKAIIDLLKVLEISIIAEGVETEQQLKKIELAGCYNVQGFLFGRPAPIKEIEKLIVEKGFQIRN